VRPINWAATEAVHAWLRHTGSQHQALERHLPRRGHVSTRLPDGQWARFWSQGDDNMASRIFWREWHGIEPEQTLLFEQFGTPPVWWTGVDWVDQTVVELLS
jgi:hypothetical protein